LAGEVAFPRESDQSPFAVSVVTTTGRTDVSVAGEIDLTTRDALAGVLDAACSLEPHVRLDLSGLRFLDPQGALLLARRQADHPRLEISAASAAVHRVCEILAEIGMVGDTPHIGGASAYDGSIT
jgi:anti-anti-sigma regulatory factor